MANPIDVNLFVQAASQGYNDGARFGTPFSNFLNGLTSGAQQELKNEEERQQIQIRQNQIEQLPVSNRIQEAQADEADAKLALYRDNPQEFLARQQEAAKVQDMENRQKEQLMIQKTNFENVMQSGNGEEQAKAVLSGQFTSLFAAIPGYQKAAVEQTFVNWPKNYQDAYFEQERKKRNDDLLQQIQETKLKSYTSTMDDLENDGEVNRLRQLAVQQFGTDDSSFLEQGRVGVANKYPLAPKKVLDDNGQPVKVTNPDGSVTIKVEKDANGNTVMAPDRNAMPSEIKQVKTFLIGNQPLLEADGNPVVVQDRTSTLFSNGQRAYNYMNNLLRNQNMNPNKANPTDLRAGVQAAEEQRQARQAAQDALNSQDPAQVQAAQDKFFSGAKINPQYQQYAKQVQTDIRAQRQPTITPAAQVESASTPAPHVEAQKFMPFVPPTPVTESTPTPKVSPEGTPATAVTPAPQQTVWPSRTPAPVDQNQAASPSQMTPTSPAPVPETSATPQTQKDALIQAKAKAALDKYNKETPTPNQAGKQGGSSFVPEAGASEMTQPRNTPPTVLPQVPEIRVNLDAHPNMDAIRTVAARPEVQGFSALTKAVMATESGGRQDATSYTGAKGLMQLTGRTARDIGNLDTGNPIDNAIGGAIYLEKLLATPQFNNNPMLALTAYNAGAGVVADAIALAGNTTDWNEIKKVLPDAVRMYDKYWKDNGINTEDKVKEVMGYADKVIANFPAFILTNKDMSVAYRLKQQGLLSF